MKKVDVPLAELTLAQKLDLMEKLWADLSRDEKKVKSPVWHEAILRDREESLAAERISASDWEHVKKRIKKKIS